MGVLTEREKDILRMLKDGKTSKEIARSLNVPVTSVSRSITSIKRKARDIEEDVLFMDSIGYLTLNSKGLIFISPDRDPKALTKKKA